MYEERNIKKNKSVRTGFIIVITVALTAILTLGMSSIYYKYYYASNKDFSKLSIVYKELSDNYYLEIDDEVLLEGAVRGMVDGLDDPYSTYMDSDEVKDFYMALDNQFVGVGISLESAKEGTYISEVFEGSPAKESGLLEGDLIFSVNGESMLMKNSTEVASSARGPEGSEVVMGVLRDGNSEELLFTIKRAHIDFDDLEYAMLDNGIGYIKLMDFTSTIHSQFEESYDTLDNKGMTKLIIDVRDNGGGYLDQAVKIIDMFVDDSKPIYQEKIRNKITKEQFGNKSKKDIEVVVIVNEDSASASELLTAALREINGSSVVGTTTFGKGTAQTSKEYSDSSALKFTFAQWLTPDGNWINGIGVKPTVEVALDEKFDHRNVLISEPVGVDTVSQQTVNAQKILNLLGYETRIDGYFDQNMSVKLNEFQTANKIEVTGILDSQTAAKINELFANYLADYKNDNQIMKAIEVLENE